MCQKFLRHIECLCRYPEVEMSLTTARNDKSSDVIEAELEVGVVMEGCDWGVSQSQMT